MREIYMRLSMTASMLLMLASVVLAQERNVTGKVTDENGSGMPGVNVLVKGTSTGTATDSDGVFNISVPNDQATLVFTFVGYSTNEVAVGNRSTLDVQLAPDIETLNELVVTGYAEQRKRDITGAVSVVDAEELKTIKAANIGQQLAGRAPGVTVSTSGGPGEGANIRIRGVNSITGNSDPLIIIDGVQIQGDKNLSGLNPNDIESMQVLKDAASASIYGSRANNGVIIITTKQGKSGKVAVTYNGYYGVQNPVGGYNDFLLKDPQAYAQQYHTIKNPSTGFDATAGSSAGTFYGGLGANATIPEYFYQATDADGNPLPESAYNYPVDPRIAPTLFMKSNTAGTDWWEEVFDPAPITNHNLGISGGSESATYAASVDYFRQEGTMIHTYFERVSARVNSQFKAGRFTFGETFSFARSANVGQSGGNQNEQNTMTQILKMNSIVPVYDVSGVNFASAKTTGFSNGSNPVALQYRNRDDEGINYRILGGLNGEFRITDYLRAKTNFNIDFGQNFTQDFAFPTYENREVNATNFFSETHRSDFNWVWTNSLHFNKTFSDVHEVGAFIGYEALKNHARQVGGRLDSYPFTYVDIRYLNQALAPTVNNVNSQAPTFNTIASMFAQLNYTYNDKYLLSATVRRDGSSNFAEDRRYGTFPAVSLGWRISEESFLQNVDVLEDLKIRGGYGITGNQIIPPYNAYDRWGARTVYDAGYDIVGNNASNAAGFVLTNYGNPVTGWEENRMSNIGFDATLLDGKIGLVFDVYKKDIVDLLYSGNYPGLAGAAAAPARNTANMTNNGWDASIDYRGNITSDIGLNLGLNLSHYKNEIKLLEGDTEILFPAGPDKRFGEINAWMVGQPIGAFYGFQHDGIFQSQAELDEVEQNGEAIGRFRWKDLNDDGLINDADKGMIGNPHPKLTMGLNIGLTYKAFDFNMFLFGSFGNDIYNYNKLFTHFGFFNSNISEEVLTNSWTPESGGGLPAIDPNDSFSLTSSSFYVEDGSYVRAQNVTLGYTLPANKVFQKLRIYVQGQNLFTITDYSGIDPALSNVNIGGANTGRENSWLGFDFGNYPSSRTVMVGVNASF